MNNFSSVSNESFSGFVEANAPTLRFRLEPPGIGLRSDVWISYAASMSPIYDGLSAIITQVSVLLILGQGKGCFDTYYQMARTPYEQVSEYRHIMAEISPPATARGHYRHMCRVADRLTALTATLNLKVRDTPDIVNSLASWTSELHQCLTMLRCAADPVVKMQSVSFEECCAGCTMPVVETPAQY